MLPPANPDRIPTEPTIDAGPPDATPVAPGTSLAPSSPAAGRRRRTWTRRVVIVAMLVATFTVGIGVGRLATASGGEATAPSPADTEFGIIREAWDTLHKNYVARDELDDR